jgi:hypothetical protein
MCFAGHVPTSMDECAGSVVLGMMVCAVNEYAPLFINDNTFTIFDFAIASGRRPSKLTINTRAAFGTGVDVIVGKAVSMGGIGVPVGPSIGMRTGASVGGGTETGDPQACKKIERSINP